MAVQTLASLLSGSAAVALPHRNPSGKRKAVPFKGLEMHRQARPVHTPVAVANNYDVFLSFRGPDTRQSFNDHLRESLKGHGFRVFKDDHDLLGEQIGPGLYQAIENSKIYIPIFSKNYTSSKWCLEELRKMLECLNAKNCSVLLPIFYDVDVSDVCHED